MQGNLIQSFNYKFIKGNFKYIRLIVKPDLTVEVKYPIELGTDKLNNFLFKKESWVRKQLNYFQQHTKLYSEQQIVSGRSIYLLGKLYKLKLVDSGSNSIAKSYNSIRIETKYSHDEFGKNLGIYEKWLTNYSYEVFLSRYSKIKNDFEYEYFPELRIRKMKTRWGSINRNKIINLNRLLIHTPISCIDLVIYHELCHIIHPNHSDEFYVLLERKYSGWKKIKEKLDSYQKLLY